MRQVASHRAENHLEIEISPALSCVDRVGDIVFCQRHIGATWSEKKEMGRRGKFSSIVALSLISVRVHIVAAKQTPCLLCRKQGVKPRRGIAFVGLAQIDELFAVANVDVSFYRVRHNTAIQVVEGAFLSLLLYVLHGRNDKATEEL